MQNDPPFLVQYALIKTDNYSLIPEKGSFLILVPEMDDDSTLNKNVKITPPNKK